MSRWTAPNVTKSVLGVELGWVWALVVVLMGLSWKLGAGGPPSHAAYH
jgi:hypothetical protein